MALRNARDLVFKPAGLTDSLDGTNAPSGSMSSLQNLVLSYGTDGVFVPRPAATPAVDFKFFAPSGVVSALVTVGNRAYGWVASALFPGCDEPFCYDFGAQGFIALQGVQQGLLPATQATTGDWVPPVVAAVTNSLILFLHPGYVGGSGPFFGWLDISGYSATVIANTTSGSKVLTGVVTTLGTSAPILQGVQPGQVASGAGIPTISIPGGVLGAESGTVLATEDGTELGLGSASSGDPVQSCVNGTFSLNTTGTTHSNATLDGLASTTGVIAGMMVSGPGILAGTYVTNVNSSTSVTLSQAAVATATGVAINFSGGGTITLQTAATATANNVTVTIAGGTYGQPLWGAGNFNTNPLTTLPAAAAGFNGRAYVGAGPYLVYSDPLMPLQVSLASQALVIGDNTPITALASVPLTSQLTGGVQQSLTVFKGAGSLTQITGDAATNNLAQNVVAGSVGTLAPNSIAGTPYGLAFISIDGLRVLGLTGTESEPIGTGGTGVVVPFLNALFPSRMCAAFAEDIYRVTVQNGALAADPVVEYWFDFRSGKWTGPHTCAMRLVAAFGSGSGFLGAPWGADAALWQSGVLPVSASTYVENGNPLVCIYETSLMPDNHQGAFNKVMQSSLSVAIHSSDSLTVSATDDTGATLDSVNLNGAAPGASLWGAARWGSFTWGAAPASLREVPLKWHQPLVFRQAYLSATFAAAAGQAVGNFYAKAQPVNVNTPLI